VAADGGECLRAGDQRSLSLFSLAATEGGRGTGPWWIWLESFYWVPAVGGSGLWMWIACSVTGRCAGNVGNVGNAFVPIPVGQSVSRGGGG